MKVLEVGRYIAPAYAGMVLAENNVDVVKWVMQEEPILSLRHSGVLWDWINYGKTLEPIDGRRMENASGFDVIVTNLRSADCEAIAASTGSAVVKLEGVNGARSFDVIAQAQAWGDFVPWVPFYIGDTVAGLWMALKALAVKSGDICRIQHPACLAKLVECELHEVNATRTRHDVPWEGKENYKIADTGAFVSYNAEEIIEPFRDHDWRLKNIRRIGWRIII